ncbi:hypothetical protein [Spartinivicinus ruber]|uniref:hypothetical protein n=1 Tax=Spartinivicinus ruber TaxID=2683272 RepID=UPI0013D11D17|nr:hypothetical protein [Spartinivicinus ruber]
MIFVPIQKEKGSSLTSITGFYYLVLDEAARASCSLVHNEYWLRKYYMFETLKTLILSQQVNIPENFGEEFETFKVSQAK